MISHQKLPSAWILGLTQELRSIIQKLSPVSLAAPKIELKRAQKHGKTGPLNITPDVQEFKGK